MPSITVNSPFSLRMGSGAPVREFSAGEHKLSDQELAHWFVQGCIKEGRALLLPGTGKGKTDKGEAKKKRPAKKNEVRTEAPARPGELSDAQVRALAADMGLTDSESPQASLRIRKTGKGKRG